MPSAETMPPPMPASAPKRKPVRRPNRCIKSDAGRVIAMVESAMMPAGKVASDLSSARICPTRPDMVMPTIKAPQKSAWQADSRRTFRSMRKNDTGKTSF